MNKSVKKPIQLRIHGMDCAEEIALLKRELLPVVGNEERLGFDVLNGKLLVDLSDLNITRDDVLAAIKRTGLTSESWRESAPASQEQSFWQKHQRTILTTVSGLFGVTGLIIPIIRR